MVGNAGVRPSAKDASAADVVYMRRALALAQRGWGHTAPNPMVGAVVVADGTVVGEGYHAVYGEAHAEVGALQMASERARGATLYITLEPCAHQGKTPPCADAVIAAGIARVVMAARDPSVLARGGVERLRQAGVDVVIGVERDAAVELNAAFFNAHLAARPWVTLKLAVSRDGLVADPRGVHRWITGPESRAEVHRLRANADAIAVGVGTVIADDPELTVRDAPPPRVAPRRVVFDSHLRIPLSSKIVRNATDGRTTIIAGPGVRARVLKALGEAGVEVVVGMRRLADAMSFLFERGTHALFVEGGPRLAGSFLRESLVDRLTIFRSTLELDDRAGALRAFAFAPDGFEASIERYRVVDERPFGADVMTTYALREISCSPD